MRRGFLLLFLGGFWGLSPSEHGVPQGIGTGGYVNDVTPGSIVIEIMHSTAQLPISDHPKGALSSSGPGIQLHAAIPSQLAGQLGVQLRPAAVSNTRQQALWLMSSTVDGRR